MQIEQIDISQLPLLNTDLIANGAYPPVVEAFRQKILRADSILFASPENNYSLTGNPLSNFSSCIMREAQNFYLIYFFGTLALWQHL